MRSVSFGRVLGSLMIPVSVAIVPDAVPALVLNIPVGKLSLALPKSITPALRVQGVTQVTGHVLFVLTLDHIDRLSAAAATILKTVSESGWITFGQ